MMQRWREHFAQHPSQALADLFSGRARISAAGRLDTPELLLRAFPDTPEWASARAQLDSALLDCLTEMRRHYRAQVDRLGYAVYALRLCHALRAMQLLDLPRSTHQLREHASHWLPWLTPLRLAPERDPALECWRLLSQRQPDHSQLPDWLRLAADRRPEYLNVALLGIQRLPTIRDEAASHDEALQLTALLRHAASLPHDQALADFKHRYAALRGRYPRAPAYWRSLLEQTLATELKHAQGAAKTLYADLQPHTTAEQSGKAAKSGKPALSPIPFEEKQALKLAIQDRRQSSASVAERFIAIVSHELRYAEHSGDAHFFVRTLCHYGKQLLKRRDLPAPLLTQLEGWIEQALHWEPHNEFTWTFWADVLAWQGRHDAQAWVLSEAARLFPDNEPSRVELARLLIRRGEAHWGEAEGWLRQVVERNPDHEHSRVELARLLIRRGEAHWGEAEGWLRQVAERHPDSEPSRVELARLLMRRGKAHWDEAEGWLRQVAERYPNDGPSHVVLTHLLAASGREAEALAILGGFVAREPHNARARQLLSRLQPGVLATLELDELDFNELDTETENLPVQACLTPPVAERGRLAQLQQRAHWQRSLLADEALAEVRQAAEQGEPLAGVCLAWLRQDPWREAPPQAWAWQLARAFRADAPVDWPALTQRFPEQFDLTLYLRWLAAPSAELETQLSQRFAKLQAQQATLRPALRFALARWNALLQSPEGRQADERREDNALAVLLAEAA